MSDSLPVAHQPSELSPTGMAFPTSMMILVAPTDCCTEHGDGDPLKAFEARISTCVNKAGMDVVRDQPFGMPTEYVTTVRHASWTIAVGESPQQAIERAIQFHSERDDLR